MFPSKPVTGRAVGLLPSEKIAFTKKYLQERLAPQSHFHILGIIWSSVWSEKLLTFATLAPCEYTKLLAPPPS
jgi:hypothetical protein